MKKDRDKLSVTLTAILMKNNANNKLREKVEDELQNKFRAGIVNDIYNLRRQTKFLSEEELYLFTNAIYNNFELLKKGTDVTRDLIDPKNWFTDNEIINANQINFTADKKEDNIWFELHNVDMPEEGVWISSYETYKNLADNWNRGAIFYNQETQREGIIKTILGEQITVPKLIDKNVDEIYKAMLNHEFFANMITLNIQDTGLEKEFIEYYPESRILRVKKTNDSVVAILDGFHRLSSILRVTSDYPDFDGYMSIRVFNLDVQKAQSLILQESRGTSIGEQTIKTFDVKNKYMQIAKKINNYESESTNTLYHKLTYVFDEVKNNTKYCLFSNISNGLEDNFEDIIENASPRDIDKLTRYLVAFYNEFIGYTTIILRI